jgi:hypothetical protein
MSDLETLIPQAVELVIDGEPLAIKPLKVGQMPAFLRAISPVMQQITRPHRLAGAVRRARRRPAVGHPLPSASLARGSTSWLPTRPSCWRPR